MAASSLLLSFLIEAIANGQLGLQVSRHLTSAANVLYTASKNGWMTGETMTYRIKQVGAQSEDGLR